MPAPVEFTIRLAALPPGFSGDPQALATAIAERLMITPSEPWSSFINGGAQPAANVGPFLAGGKEWKVWSDDLGSYTFQTLDGAGLVNFSVTRDAMEDGPPNSVIIYDSAGRPASTAGTPLQVLTVGADFKPYFTLPATGVFFSMQLSTPQPYTADFNGHAIEFDSVVFAQGVVPDIVNNRVPVPAGSLWVFGASAQLDTINGAITAATHIIGIRPYQSNATLFGSLLEQTGSTGQQGVQATGLYYFQNDGYADVTISSDSSAHGNDFQVSNNGSNTRFWGFRLI